AAGNVRGRAAWIQAPRPVTNSVFRLPSSDSVHPRELLEARVPLLQESVPALGRLVGHVSQAGRLPGEDLLADQPVVDQVESEFQHPLGGGRFGGDLSGPLKSGRLQL